MTVFTALGDSITVGMGDPVEGGWRGWAALLAGSLDQPELYNLATLGALAADVERHQLPAAVALAPDVASVIVGINDTLRGDFDPERTGASIGRTVAALRAAGAEVLTTRLPDPGQMFGLPGALARPLARRIRAVNAAVDPRAVEPPPTRLAEFGWMATKGTGWLFRRYRDLVPALAALTVREWRAGENGTEPDVASETVPT
jgi:lysophospholipase L1-like esterase